MLVGCSPILEQCFIRKLASLSYITPTQYFLISRRYHIFLQQISPSNLGFLSSDWQRTKWKNEKIEQTIWPITINYRAANMLDWCQRVQQKPAQRAQLIFYPQGESLPAKKCRNLVPPHLTQPFATARRRQNSSRKGIQIHFSQNFKTHKHNNTALELTPPTMSLSTQTPRCQRHLCITPQHTITLRPCDPSATRVARFNQPVHTQCKSQLYSVLEQTRRISADQKPDRNRQNRQTKASFDLIESQEPIPLFEKPSQLCLKNAESFQASFQEEGTMLIGMQRQEHRVHFYNRLPQRLFTFQFAQNEGPNKISIKSSNSFSDKCKLAIKNVESEFKQSQKKKEARKNKNTPLRRILFHDRDTIVSKYNDSHRDSQRSIPIEQSFILDMQARSLFVSWHLIHAHAAYTLSLAFESLLGLVVSIKEVPIVFMSRISVEIVAYKQLDEAGGNAKKRFLSLYQTQIDKDSYLFIKEPFSSTLASHLHMTNRLFVLSQIKSIFIEMQREGLYLRTIPKIQDFVVCFGEIKLQNLEILQCEEGDSLDIEAALSKLEEEIKYQYQ